MKKIQIIECSIFTHDGQIVSSEIGVYVRGKDNQIGLFSINRHERRGFIENIASICDQVAKTISSSKSILDFNWTYSASGGTSILTFEKQNGLPVSLTIENGWVAQIYCCLLKVNDYEIAINDPRGIDASLQDGHIKGIDFTEPSKKRYLVHTPLRAQKIYMLRNPCSSDYPVVNLDAVKLIKYWRKDSAPSKFANSSAGKLLDKLGWSLDQGNSDDFKLLQSTEELSKSHVIPSEMAFGLGLSHQGEVRFTNGRHRTVNLANAGAPYIPTQVSGFHAEKFRELFEWR